MTTSIRFRINNIQFYAQITRFQIVLVMTTSIRPTKTSLKQNNVEPEQVQRHMVRRMGLEPTREYSHYPLKVARLPFRHLRIALSLYQYFLKKSILFLKFFYFIFL